MNGVSGYEKLRDRLAGEVNFLPDKPEETPESTLRALWLAASGTPLSAAAALRGGELPPLSGAGLTLLEDLVERRISGVPLAHLTHRQYFMGMEMLAGPEALVPRKETELLAQACVDLALQLEARQAYVNVVDVCTGSGNIALALAHQVTNARVFGADLSDAAVELARRNARYLGLEARVEFRTGDLLVPFDTAEFLGQIDLLTCNPPYINSAKVEHMPSEISAHEPQLAFDGGPFGVAIMMRLIEQAPRFVRAGGWLAFEVGLGQGPALVKRLQKMPSFSEVRTVTDGTSAVRAILARR